MTLRGRDTGALRTATEVLARKSDGSMTPVDRMMIRTPDGLSQFYKRGLRLSANPQNVSGPSNSSRQTATNATQVSVSGGTGPYSHSWSVPSPLRAGSPTSAMTPFIAPANYAGSSFATDTVTDANGLTAQISVGITIYDTGTE